MAPDKTCTMRDNKGYLTLVTERCKKLFIDILYAILWSPFSADIETNMLMRPFASLIQFLGDLNKESEWKRKRNGPFKERDRSKKGCMAIYKWETKREGETRVLLGKPEAFVTF